MCKATQINGTLELWQTIKRNFLEETIQTMGPIGGTQMMTILWLMSTGDNIKHTHTPIHSIDRGEQYANIYIVPICGTKCLCGVRLHTVHFWGSNRSWMRSQTSRQTFVCRQTDKQNRCFSSEKLTVATFNGHRFDRSHANAISPLQIQNAKVNEVSGLKKKRKKNKKPKWKLFPKRS